MERKTIILIVALLVFLVPIITGCGKAERSQVDAVKPGTQVLLSHDRAVVMKNTRPIGDFPPGASCITEKDSMGTVLGTDPDRPDRLVVQYSPLRHPSFAKCPKDTIFFLDAKDFWNLRTTSTSEFLQKQQADELERRREKDLVNRLTGK